MQELSTYYIRDIIALQYPSNSTFHHFGISYGRSMSNAYNACASIPLKLTLHRDAYLITSRLYSFPLDLRSREHRSFGEDLRSNAHDASALKFFAKRRVACLLLAGQEGTAVIGIPCTVPWAAVHRLAVTRCDMPIVRQRHRIGTRALKRSRVDTPRFCYRYLSFAGRALDIPIKLRLIRVTRQLNISPFARKGHRESCPAILNPHREFCAYSLSSCTHARERVREVCAKLCCIACGGTIRRAPPPIPRSRGISFSRKDYSYRNPAWVSARIDGWNSLPLLASSFS